MTDAPRPPRTILAAAVAPLAAPPVMLLIVGAFSFDQYASFREALVDVGGAWLMYSMVGLPIAYLAEGAVLAASIGFGQNAATMSARNVLALGSVTGAITMGIVSFWGESPRLGPLAIGAATGVASAALFMIVRDGFSSRTPSTSSEPVPSQTRIGI